MSSLAQIFYMLLDDEDGLSYLVDGAFDSAVTSAPESGMFLAVDDLNTSSFGTVDDIGFYDASDDSIEYAFDIDVSGNVDIIENGAVVANNVFTMSTGVNYDLAIQLQDDLTAHYFIYDSTQLAWKRVWVGSFVTSALLLYADDQFTGGAHTTARETFGTGMTPESVAIDIASPQVGDGSVSGGDPALPDADFVMQFTLDTLGSTFIGVSFAYQSALDFWEFRITAAGALNLYEHDNSVPGVLRAATTPPLVGGETITLVRYGNTILAYYDGTIGLNYSSANRLIRKADWEVNSLGTTGAISNLKVWKRYARNESGLGAELVINGGFDTDTDWTKGTGWTISGGTASCDGTQVAVTNLQQNGVVESGKYYLVEYTVSNYTSGSVRTFTSPAVLFSPFVSANGTYSYHFRGDTGNILVQGDASFVGDVDNVSVNEQLFANSALGNKLNQAVA